MISQMVGEAGIFGSLGQHQSNRRTSSPSPCQSRHELQTVQEAEPVGSPKVLGGPQSGLDPNPSSRPLGRYGKWSAGEEPRPVQNTHAGTPEVTSFKQTVAELLKEEEYGMFRLVAPHIRVGKDAFNRYVDWLNIERNNQKNSTQQDSKSAMARPWNGRSIFGLPLLLPYSRLAFAWMGFIMFVDLTWTAFGVPVHVAFCTVDYGRLGSACVGPELAFGLIYFANLLFSFHLGAMLVNGHRKKAVMDGSKLAWFYVRHGRFILDVASCIPLLYLVIIIGTSDGHGSQHKWINVLSLIRLLRLLRLVTVSKVIYIEGSLGADGWLARYFNITALYGIMVTYQIAVLVNLLACIQVLLAFLRGVEESWMHNSNFPLENGSRVYQWYTAVYWVITATTTTGFGDIIPAWWAEQVVINLCMVLGMLSFGVLVASVSSGMARATSTATRLHQHIRKIGQVNRWLSSSKLGIASKLKIQEYFAEVFIAKQEVEYGETELFADLPGYLRSEVAKDLALPLVQAVHAVRDLNPDAQQLLATHLRPVRAIVGTELCRQGDDGDRLWLLASGRLLARRYKEQPQYITAPALVGESIILAMDVPQCRFRPWTLRTLSPAELWELRLPDLSRVVTIYPALRLCLMEHVRKALVHHLIGIPAHTFWSTRVGVPQTLQDWCELSSLLCCSVDGVHGELPVPLNDLSIELERAHIDDGSLQALLGALVESAMVRDGLAPEATLGLPLGLQNNPQQPEQQPPRDSAPNLATARTGVPSPTAHAALTDPRPGPEPWDKPFASSEQAPHASEAMVALGGPSGEPSEQLPSFTPVGGSSDLSGQHAAKSGAAARPGPAWPLVVFGMRRVVSQQRVREESPEDSARAGGTGTKGIRHTRSSSLDTSSSSGAPAPAVTLVQDPFERPSARTRARATSEGGDGAATERSGSDKGQLKVAATQGGDGMASGGVAMPDPIALETGLISRQVPAPAVLEGSSPRNRAASTSDALGQSCTAASGQVPYLSGHSPTLLQQSRPTRLGIPGASAGSISGTVAAVNRRTALSRFSSPFATLTSMAPAVPHAGGPLPAAAAASAAGPAASVGCAAGGSPARRKSLFAHPSGPHPHASHMPPQHQHSHPCTACGAAACPMCGTWVTGSGLHPTMSGATSAAQGVAARSLTDALGPRTSAAGGGMTQAYGPHALPSAAALVAAAFGVPAQQQAPQQQQPWPEPHQSRPPGSPLRALNRRSHMYGRSLAATMRMDGLMRDTLARETLTRVSTMPHGRQNAGEEPAAAEWGAL